VTLAGTPLVGARLVLTRPDDRTGIGDALRTLGATVLHVPATRIVPIRAGIQAARAAYAEADWVLWTSRRAVELVVGQALPTTRATPPRFACVGPATAEALREVGGTPAVVADPPDQDGLLAALLGVDALAGSRVLFPAALDARDTLEVGLRDAGATVERVDCYDSVPDPTTAARLRELETVGDLDLVVFTAPSTVHGWAAAVGAEAARGLAGASIGSRTTEACRAHRIPVACEAASSTADGLVTAIAAWGAARPPQRSAH
jgi:uroporphyrinogen-III synthase